MQKIFDSVADLPANVRRRLNPSQQRVFRRVFNRTFRAANGSTSDKESAAFRAANGIVRNMGKRFAGVGDLPSKLKSDLSPAQQRRFVSVFNRTEARTGSRSRAFSAAHDAIHKGIEFRRTVQIEKIEPEKRIVWGWAYVCEDADGQVVDHGGDIVETLEMEKAAHSFNLESRVGNVMHKGQAGDIVDSVFFSKAVQEALGINLGKIGWFVGFRVSDDEAWEGVKSGKFKAFSIGGNAQTEKLDDAGA
jgi:cation transport regulator ChaB